MTASLRRARIGLEALAFVGGDEAPRGGARGRGSRPARRRSAPLADGVAELSSGPCGRRRPGRAPLRAAGRGHPRSHRGRRCRRVRRRRISPSSSRSMGDGGAELVAGRPLAGAERKDQHGEQPSGPAVRQIVANAHQRFLNLPQRQIVRPGEERQVGGLPAIVMEALDRRRGDVHPGNGVGEAPAEFFAALEGTPERAERHVGCERKRGAQARQAAKIRSQRRLLRRMFAGRCQGPRRGLSLHCGEEAQMAEESAVERGQRRFPGRLHFVSEKRVAAHRTLPEDDERAG